MVSADAFKYVPKTTATTFAFFSVFILLLCYQAMLEDLAGGVDGLVEGGSQQDGVEVAGEAEEQLHRAQSPHAKQQAARSTWILGCSDSALFAIFEKWTHCCRIGIFLGVQFQKIGKFGRKVFT